MISRQIICGASALMALITPVRLLAQNTPSPPAPEILELPSLDEELSTDPKPWQQTPPEQPEAEPPPVETEAERLAKTVRLAGLDKITGRISSFDAPVDRPTGFGVLEIIPRTCHKRPPEEPPETSAYLEIRDLGFSKHSGPKKDDAGKVVFSGWMFASSPALSALEHPVYDIWVIDCSASTPVQGSGSE